MDKDNLNTEDPIGMEPLDEKTTRNLLEGMDRISEQSENMGKINYRGYLGNQTPAQKLAKLIPPEPKPRQVHAQFDAHTPRPEQQFQFPRVPRTTVPPNPTETPAADAVAAGFLGTLADAQNQPPQPVTQTNKPQTLEPEQVSKDDRFRDEVLAKRFVYNPDYIAPPAVLRLNGERFGTLEGLSLIGGKPKSGKTSLMVAAIVAYLKRAKVCGWEGMPPDDRPEVVWIDTEQSPADLHIVLKRILRTCNESESKNLCVYHLRDYRGAELISAVQTISQAHPRAALMALDHAGDACFNSNDPVETRSNVNALHQIAIQNRTHLMLLVHMNKHTQHTGPGSNNSGGFEGWLGKEIQKKAETAIAVYKDDKTPGTRGVTCTDARGRDIPAFQFRIESQDELPLMLERATYNAEEGGRAKLTTQPFQIVPEVHAESVAVVFSDGQPLSLNQLEPRMKSELSQRTGKTCTEAMAKQWREHWIQVGVMTTEGTPGTRSLKYYPTDPNWIHQPTPPPQPEQVDRMAAELPLMPKASQVGKSRAKGKRAKRKA